MTRYKIVCLACRERLVIPGDVCPRFCPYCGSDRVREVTTLKQERRVQAERLMKNLDVLCIQVEQAYYRYVKLYGRYKSGIEELKEFRRKKAVSEEETEPYIRAYNGVLRIPTNLVQTIEENVPDPSDVITHGDEIRAMNDEQLAKFLCEFRECNSEEHPCNSCVATSNCYPGHCGMENWVRSLVKED